MSDELEEKDIEAGHAAPTESRLKPEGTSQFVPISSPTQTRTRNDSLARLPTVLTPISRSRSNNGYGCDDHELSDESENIEGGQADGGATKDPWEVRWDGGDSDKMNPRSLRLGRKWVVVVIVSASSLCV